MLAWIINKKCLYKKLVKPKEYNMRVYMELSGTDKIEGQELRDTTMRMAWVIGALALCLLSACDDRTPIVTRSHQSKEYAAECDKKCEEKYRHGVDFVSYGGDCFCK
jgi:hypothetical protein